MILPKRIWLSRTCFAGKTVISLKILIFKAFSASSRRIYCLNCYYKYSNISFLFTPRQHQRHNTQLRKLGFKLINDLLRLWAEGGVADDAELDAAAIAQDGDA